jgi:hypothetical protein
MRVCRKDLSAYQKRSMRTIEFMLGISVAVNILLQAILYRHHPPLATRYGMAVLSIAPIVMTIILVARYLHGERDEYLRNLVVESMLWGLAAVLVADSFLSFIDLTPLLVPLAGSLSLDIFLLAATFILETKLWSRP